jgi:CRISPR-associated protein Cmr2
MSNTYTAITIGPIIKTLLKAKRTREAWQASYFFSYVMKCISDKAKTKGAIILPADKGNFDYYGAGIYPDRLIMRTENQFDVDTTIIQPALKDVSNQLSLNTNLLKGYLNVHFVQIDEDKLNEFELKDDKNVPMNSYIHKLNYLLNVKELNPNYSTSDEGFIKDLFDDKTRKALYKIAYNNKKHQFDSIFEITAQGNEYIQNRIEELSKDNIDDIDEVLLNEEEVDSKLLKHQKYLAILRADGDNFGKVISAISSDSNLVTKFSTDIVNFSKKASDIIHNFGGTIIYIGGDDVLAFCPLINNGKNIFKIIKELNDAFLIAFSDKVYQDNKVSLSYGLSISYYKYPLNEALDTSYKLLFEKAKNEPLKNCIAFQVLLHSGSLKETILNFEKDSNFDSFIRMLGELKEKDQLLQSLTHQLIEDATLLELCLKNEKRLDGYFDNHYNPERKRNEVREFIEAMKSNLKANYNIFQKSNLVKQANNKPVIENIETKALQQMNAIAKTINLLID